MCQKGDSGRRNDTGALYRSFPGGEARGESSGDPLTGLPCVHTEQNPRRRRCGGERVREGESNRINSGCIERRPAGHGADAIGSKELLHELLVSVTFASSIFVCVTSASSVPLARRARIVWPAAVSAAERNTLPSAA